MRIGDVIADITETISITWILVNLLTNTQNVKYFRNEIPRLPKISGHSITSSFKRLAGGTGTGDLHSEIH